MSLDTKIKLFINKAWRRIYFNFLIKNIIVGITFSLCISIMLMLVSLVIPFTSVYKVVYGVNIAFLILSIGYSYIKRPRDKEVALILDSKGLKERVITALELVGREDEISVAQKEDALKALEAFNLKKELKIEVNLKDIGYILILIFVLLSVGFIDTEAKRKGDELRKIKETQKEIIEEIKKEKKEIEENKELTEEEKTEAKEILERAKEELLEAKTKNETDKVMERLEKKLEDLKEKTKSEEAKKSIDEMKKDLLEEFNKEKEKQANKDLNALKNNLNQSEEGEKLTKALESGDEKAIEEAIENLNDALKEMGEGEKSKISKALSKAASSVSDEDLKEALENASSGAIDGEISPEDLANALKSLNKKAGNGNGSGAGTGTGEGSGSGSGSGAGSGSGTGTGQGAGTGTGWNTGSKEGTQGDNITNKGEQIYIPGRGEGDDTNLSGDKNENGNSQSFETSSGLNGSGSKDSYDKYLGDYSKDALDNLDNTTLPESLKRLIREYFEGL